jgi:hypothetical protein
MAICCGQEKTRLAASSQITATRGSESSKLWGVCSGPLETEPMMQYYSSFVTFPGNANSFAVRAKTDPPSLLPTIERTIWGLDADLAMSGTKRGTHNLIGDPGATLRKRIYCLDSRRRLCSFLRSVSSERRRFRRRGICESRHMHGARRNGSRRAPARNNSQYRYCLCRLSSWPASVVRDASRAYRVSVWPFP